MTLLPIRQAEVCLNQREDSRQLTIWVGHELTIRRKRVRASIDCKPMFHGLANGLAFYFLDMVDEEIV